MTKYRSNRNSTTEKGYNILSIVEKAKYKFENMETEDDYLMKELRKDRKFLRKLIFLYGQRAGNHYNEIKNNDEFKAKLDKNIFFSPKEINKIKRGNYRNKTEKNFIPLLPNYFYDKKKSYDKFYKTKTIIGKEKQAYNTPKNSKGIFGFYNTTSNIKVINTNNIRKMNINKKNISDLSKKYILKTEDEYLNLNKRQDDMRDKIIFHELKKNSLLKNKTILISSFSDMLLQLYLSSLNFFSSLFIYKDDTLLIFSSFNFDIK